MLIEILSRNMEKKSEILTYLAGFKNFHASSSGVTVDGLKMEIGDDYLFFEITDWFLGNEILIKLFDVVPSPVAQNYFEIFCDQKVIVTARALSLFKILPHLNGIEHLDLERGELDGNYQIRWTSHDVSLTASGKVLVQGAVAVSKIKFTPHFWDSQYHCCACIGQVSLVDIASLFTDEINDSSSGPEVGPIVLRGTGTVPGDSWAQVMKFLPGKIVYLTGLNQFRIVYTEENYVAFSPGEGKGVICTLHMEEPAYFTDELAGALLKLGFVEVRVECTIRRISLDPDRLLHQLGFEKEPSFYLFSCEQEDFTAVYDIRERVMNIKSVVSLNDYGLQAKVSTLYRAVKTFVQVVLDHAG